MQVQIMFGEPESFQDVPFDTWLSGDDNTAFLLLPDAVVSEETCEILKYKEEASPVAYRLHSSQAPEVHKAQRKAICEIWRHAEELTSFSHLPGTAVFDQVFKLREETNRPNTVKIIVEGALKEVILQALDEAATCDQLCLLLNNENNAQALDDALEKLDRLLDGNSSALQGLDNVREATDGSLSKTLASIATQYLD